ncbi:MAG: histidinol-phosphatase [Clostridiales bacterium]|nr:histidinol-phosphatase [Clostridiales bacterium]
MLNNYHTHTFRCRHAFGTEREYIETAISRGLKTLGFSDHSPQIFPNGYYSNYRMYPEEIDSYFTTLRALREEYKSDIEIFIGFEAEYFPAHFNALIDFIRPYSPDYLILGQHYLKNEYDGFYSGAPTDSEERLKLYVDQTLEGLSTGYFTYFAHPDLIGFRGSDEIYDKHIRRLCTTAKEIDIPLEINLLGLGEDRAYPRERFWQIAAEVGNDVILGCDAHEPNAVARPDVLEKAAKYAARFGITPIESVKLRKI